MIEYLLRLINDESSAGGTFSALLGRRAEILHLLRRGRSAIDSGPTAAANTGPTHTSASDGASEAPPSGAERVLDELCARFEEHLMVANPHLQISPADRRHIRVAYRRLLDGVMALLDSALPAVEAAGAYRRLQRAHFARLRAVMPALRDVPLFEAPYGPPDRWRGPVAKHSAADQLAALGLVARPSAPGVGRAPSNNASAGAAPADAAPAGAAPTGADGREAVSIEPPVLDVGCGRRAGLVRTLRRLGIEAEGVDRYAPPGAGLTRADWLQFDYGVSRWGTIISYMAFTSHFIHHHRREHPRWIAYAEAYTAILESLISGGVFAYAPSVPFVEVHLDPARFAIRSVAVSAGLHASQIRRIR